MILNSFSISSNNYSPIYPYLIDKLNVTILNHGIKSIFYVVSPFKVNIYGAIKLKCYLSTINYAF